MPCIKTLQLNDVGTDILIQITECINDIETIVDITGATIEITFDRNRNNYPDNPLLIVAGQIYTNGTNGDGTDGIVIYTTKIGDVIAIGKWKAQVKLTFIDGTFHSTINNEIIVNDNLS